MNFDTIPSSSRWGPWLDGIEPAEYVARLRCLRALVHVLTGQRGTKLCALLNEGEGEPWLAADIHKALDRLDALDRRRVLSTYGSLACPQWQR